MHVCWVSSVAGFYLRCVMNGGRERRARVSPWQPTCLWPFIKPGRVEEREGLTVTDRALCWTRGGPCCLLTQTAPHAQLQNGASMQTASAATQHNWCPSHSFNVLRIPHWTNRLLRRQVAMPMNDTHPHNPPRGICDTDTEDMLQHPSDWTKRRATQTKLRVKQNTLGVWSGRSKPATGSSSVDCRVTFVQ